MLAEHAPDLHVHTVLADQFLGQEEVDELEEMVAAYGAQLVFDDVAEAPGAPRHDPVKLAAAYSKIMSGSG